jgi:predicted HTH transcriptional regulator
MGCKNNSNQGTGVKADLSVMISKVLGKIEKNVGMTSLELAEIFNVSQRVMQRKIKKAVRDGKLSLGAPKMILNTVGVLIPVHTYVLADKK